MCNLDDKYNTVWEDSKINKTRTMSRPKVHPRCYMTNETPRGPKQATGHKHGVKEIQ